MQPGEPPWLVAKRIDVSLTWRALFGREVLLDTIEMTDWRMVVESFPDGRQTFPRADRSAARAPAGARPGGDDAAVRARASRRAGGQRLRLGLVHGRAECRRHGRRRPASIAARCDSTTGRSGSRNTSRCRPTWWRRSRWTSGKLVFDRIDLETDGAVSTMSGVVDMAKWPEQMYQVKSHIQFPRMRELFFANDKFSLFGEGDFTGTFHMFKGGRELKGDFTSARRRRQRLPLSEPRRLGGVGARSHGGHACDLGLRRRQDGVSLQDGAARQARRAGPRANSKPTTPTST